MMEYVLGAAAIVVVLLAIRALLMLAFFFAGYDIDPRERWFDPAEFDA